MIDNIVRFIRRKLYFCKKKVPTNDIKKIISKSASLSSNVMPVIIILSWVFFERIKPLIKSPPFEGKKELYAIAVMTALKQSLNSYLESAALKNK